MSTKIKNETPDFDSHNFIRLNKELKEMIEFIPGFLRELSFNQLIFLLMFKADSVQLEKLIIAYPTQGHCFQSYKDPNYFLKK